MTLAFMEDGKLDEGSGRAQLSKVTRFLCNKLLGNSIARFITLD